jgi:ketosteroid isomerase-like protein
MGIVKVLLLPSLLLLAPPQPQAERFAPEGIIAMERGALDRWGKGDPQGYVEIMAPSVTYFDPFQAARVDGLPAIQALLAPITGKIRVDRYDMLRPNVQHHGDAAILTFNLISYVKQPDGTERAVARWNSTETYARVDGKWRIVHSHWSFTTPDLKQPVSEEKP